MKKFFFICFIIIFFNGCSVDEVTDNETKIIEYINNLDVDVRTKDIMLEIVYTVTKFILDPNNQAVIDDLTVKSFEIQNKIIESYKVKESPE